MKEDDPENRHINAQVEDLRLRLEEAEETLRAIRQGEVDALVVSTPQGDQVFTLKGAYYPYRILLETMEEGTATIGKDGTIFYCNRRLGTMLDAPLERVIGSSVKQYLSPKDWEIFQKVLTKETPENHRGEYTFQAAGGNLLPVLVSFGRLEVEGMEGVCITAVDLTGQKRAEEQCRLLAAAVEQAGDGVLIADPDFIIRYANPAFAGMTGYPPEEVVGRELKALGSGQREESFHRSLRETVKAGNIWAGLYPMMRKNGTVVQIRMNVAAVKDPSGMISHYVAHAHDLTEQMKLEEQIRRSQKMEALGTLSGGVAHDFNNILATIITNTELALFDLPQGSDLREGLEEVVKAGLRGRDLIKQILTFSRKSEKQEKVISLGSLLKESFKFLRSSVPMTIDMELRLETGSDAVFADPSQVQQVVMNLCTNAAYAMRGRMGKLEIGLQEITLESPADFPDPEMAPGDFLVLHVRDTGDGLAPDVRSRIFEPFFTTKPQGEGTGLGLAVAYGIVKSHNGAITVYSEPGKGCVFKVYLPKADKAVLLEKETPELLTGKNERVLLVDDEEMINKAVGSMLKRLGYRVTTVENGPEALKLFAADPGQFDLVITDQTMPRMTGEELAKEIMRIRPDLPVILCTGYSDMVSAEKARALGIQGFIMKPFTTREGAELIRRLLEKNRT